MSNKRDYLRPVDAPEDAARAALPEDEELSALLSHWRAPEPSHALDARLSASFRQQARPADTDAAAPPLWKRLLTARISMPVPVAAAAALILLSLPLSFAVLRLNRETNEVAPRTPSAETERVVRVEVPVVEERIVTRTVYVERRGRQRPADARRPRATEAAAPDSDVAAIPARNRKEMQGARAVGVSGFKPAEDVKLTIIKGSYGNEK